MLLGVPAELGSWLLARLVEERSRLALWLPVALGGGVLCYFALDHEPPSAWRWMALPGPALALWLARRHPLAGWAAGLVAAALLGAALAAWHAARQPPLLELPRGAILLSGHVAAVDRLPEGLRVTLDAPRFDGGAVQPRQVRVRLKAGDPAQPEPGDRLELRALLRAPAAPAYPGAWDFQRAAYFSGLGGSGFAIGPARLMPGPEGPPLLASLRAALETRIGEAIPGGAGAVAVALLTGAQNAIPAEDMAAMRDSGLAHLLSVSGLHIASVMAVTFGAVRLGLALLPWLALRLPVKALAAMAALGMGGFYMLLTGSAVPMQRCFAMAALATLALLTGRRALTLRAWALAVAAVLVVQPDAVLGPSFQMSFAAVLALVAGWEWARPGLLALRGKGRWQAPVLALAGLMLTSLLAAVATAPFGLFHFGRLQLYGMAANAVAVPLTSLLVMPAGMAAAALMPLGLEKLALLPMGWGVEATLAVARLVAAWPGAVLAASPLPAFGLGLVSLGMLWLGLWRGGWRLGGVPLILAGFASSALVRPPDLLVAADARLIALRTAEGVAWQKLPGASGLTREMWLRLWGEVEAATLPRQGAMASGAIACAPGRCNFRPGPAGQEAVLLRGDAPWEACAAAALVVSAEPVRARCRALVVDRFSVWRDGAHAIWLGRDGVRVRSDRAWRGDRPWVPPPPHPRIVAEPPAPVE